MPDLQLPGELDQVAAATPAWPRGLPELRALLGSLSGLSPNYLPGAAPAMLPDDSASTAASSSGVGGGMAADVLSGGTPGTVSGGDLTPGTVTPTKFASTVAPIVVVATKPALPSPAYPPGALVWDLSTTTVWKNVGDVWTKFDGMQGPPGAIATYAGEPVLPDGAWPPDSLVYDTVADMLKKNVADVWVPIVNTTDLQGQITSAQIKANNILSTHILAGEIKAAHLESTMVLANLLMAGAPAGSRIELDSLGFRVFATNGTTLLVSFPTDGSPFTFNGKVIATDLSSGSASLAGTSTIQGSGNLVLANGIADPSSPPTLASSIDSQTIPNAPPGHGICYDPAGDAGPNTATFWIGADPSGGGAIAYEFRKSDGVLLRTLSPHNTTQTITGQKAGSTSKVANRANGYVGSNYSQIATPIVMPNRSNMKITAIGVWLAGRNGAVNVQNSVWNTSGTQMCASAAYNASSGGATTVGASDLYEKAVTATPVAANATIWAGFLRTGTGDGSQDDVQTGSYTTKTGNGNAGNMTGIGTITTERPNVYVVYQYDTGVQVEGTMGKTVGVARVGSYVYVLDSNGKVFVYNQATLAYVGQDSLAANIPGVKANAGMFYDGTNIVVTTTAAASGASTVSLVKFTVGAPTAGNSGLTYSATNATTLAVGNAATATVRGGYTDATPNSWVAVVDATSTGVFAVPKAGGTLVANRDFGLSTEIGSGVTWDGTTFRGFASATAKIWTFTAWDWSSATLPTWVTYTWRLAAGPYETAMSPSASITLGRRRKLNVTNPSLPSGTDQVRVYLVQQAGAPTNAQVQLQVTDALTGRYLSSNAGGAAAPAATNFPAGTAAILRDPSSKFVLKGDGTTSFQDVIASASVRAAGHTVLTNSFTADSTITATVANTPYKFGSRVTADPTFTPAFVGQKFLIVWNGAMNSASTTSTALARLGLDSNTTGTTIAWACESRHKPAAASSWVPIGGSFIWTADRTTPVYVYWYGVNSGAGQTVVLAAATNFYIIPLP